ncbi:MAG: 50S ribosomal protein L25 [Acidimicrobiia bacterium]|nr:50S ribosomal protein L25 [Acidimicrobiia bacterium]
MADVLIAETGRAPGTRTSRRLRRSGQIPAVIYGLGMEPCAIALPWPELRRALVEGGTTAPVRISVEGTEHLTIIRELQRHPIRRDVTHIDFLAVDPNLTVQVEVPLVLVDPDDKGRVQLVEYSLNIEAKPGQIPNEIPVPVDLANDDNEIRLGDLTLPEGVTTQVDPELLLAGPPPEEIVDEVEEEEAAEGEEGADGEGADDAAAESSDDAAE